MSVRLSPEALGLELTLHFGPSQTPPSWEMGSFKERDSSGSRDRETHSLSNTCISCCCHSRPYCLAWQRKNSSLLQVASRLERHRVEAAKGLSGVSAEVSKGQKWGLRQWQ